MHFATTRRTTHSTVRALKEAEGVGVVGSDAYMEAHGFRKMTGREILSSWSGVPRRFWISRTVHAIKSMLQG
jgi:hypothetical protein